MQCPSTPLESLIQPCLKPLVIAVHAWCDNDYTSDHQLVSDSDLTSTDAYYLPVYIIMITTIITLVYERY